MPSQDDGILVRAEGVRKIYHKGDTEVIPLEGADLTVREGEFVALMGPSGSGKSTLLNLIAGIDSLTAGKLVVAGRDISRETEDRLADWRNRTIGYIFQQFNLIPVLTAYENVELPLLLLPLSKEARKKQVETALALVELSDRSSHYPRQLSGGQEQRVAVARALATDPKLVLADEPTGNLDRASAQSVMDLLTELNRRFKKTILLVTHDPMVGSRASRTLHLDKGILTEGAAP